MNCTNSLGTILLRSEDRCPPCQLRDDEQIMKDCEITPQQTSAVPVHLDRIGLTSASCHILFLLFLFYSDIWVAGGVPKVAILPL